MILYDIKRNVLLARPRDVLLAVGVTLFGFLQIRSFDHLFNHVVAEVRVEMDQSLAGHRPILRILALTPLDLDRLVARLEREQLLKVFVFCDLQGELVGLMAGGLLGLDPLDQL